LIDLDNWTTARYKKDGYLAFISFGAEPNHTEEIEPKFIYFVTISDLDYQELEQKSYEDIKEALNYLNQNYKTWSLINLEAPKSDSGCSTCVAH